METTTMPTSPALQRNKGLQWGMERAAKFAKPLERTVRKVPPAVYLGFGLDCCIASSCCALAGKRRLAFMFGTWSLFAVVLGVYAKLDRHMIAQDQGD